MPHELARLVDTMPAPFALSEVKCLMEQLLAAVAHLHANYILHRDLKLSNLLLTNDGVLKLCDFGLARLHVEDRGAGAGAGAAAGGESAGASDGCGCKGGGGQDVQGGGSQGGSSKSGDNQGGGSKGGGGGGEYTPQVVTLWYRAPELLLGAARYGPAVDMWSVGCILGELLLHRPLMPAPSEAKQLGMIVELLGSPSERIWPGLAQLPLWKQIRLPHNESSELARRFAKLKPSDATLGLLSGLLTYDPEARLTAEGAYAHVWFAERPLPQPRHLMPAFAVQAFKGSGAAKRVAAAPADAAGGKLPRAGAASSSTSQGGGGGAAAGAASGGAARPAARGHGTIGALARLPSPDSTLVSTARQC